MANHIMVDLETLGTSPDSAIISLGAVVFNPKTGLGEVFYSPISIDSNVRYNRTISPSTLTWWMNQSDEARALFSSLDNAPDLAYVLGQFAGFCSLHQVNWIWGNGAAFDNVLIRHACSSLELDPPVGYRGDMCFRTVKSLYPEVLLERKGTHHNALDDAVYQAQYLMELHKDYKVLDSVG